ncbi:MAG: hypothetical protein K4571_08125 [Deltaproteobacteria bacterium]
MKNYIKIILIAFMLAAFSGIALAEKITVRHEVSQEVQQGNAVTPGVQKEYRLSSKRVKDKADSAQTDVSRSAGDRMIRYQQFNDGEGEAKTRN